MKILLDTSIVIWTLAEHFALKTATKKIMTSADVCFVSSISIAEIEIKKSIGKLEITEDYIQKILESGLEPLQYDFKAAALLSDLPFHHKDPFDRMLITQTLSHNLTFLTNDKILKQYNLPVILN